MKVFLTGADGFVGGHLLRELEESGIETIATDPSGSCGPRLCLPDEEGACEILRAHHPDVIVHLAAVAHVPAANRQPELAYDVNVEGTHSLLRAAAAREHRPRFVFISTSSVYGRVPPEEQPIDETRGARPVNAYGWTKLAAEAVLHSLAPALGVPHVVLRPFNHSGPGQSSDYALSSFARQIAEIEAGQRKPIVEVGDLSVRRDILDVRDVVRAYREVVRHSELEGIFNVSADTSQPLSDHLDYLCRASTVKVETRRAETRLRKSDIPLFEGNSRALREATGWSPQIPIEKTLDDLLEGWRQSIRGELAVR